MHGSLDSQCLGVFDLFIEEFVEVETSSSGGPCYMTSRTLSVRPTDLRDASARGRESMTDTMSHLTVELHLCGKNQYATMPGSVVVPCMEYNGMAGAGVSGNCLR